MIKKYGIILIIIVLVASLIGNLYLSKQVNDYREFQELQYNGSVNDLYGYLNDINRYLYIILEEEEEVEIDDITLAIYVTNIKNANREARKATTDVRRYSNSKNTSMLYYSLSHLFGIYFEDNISHLQRSREDREEFFEVAKKLKDEVVIILDTSHEEYMQLSEREKTQHWIDIVNKLPESETLDFYKDYSDFDRLIENNRK